MVVQLIEQGGFTEAACPCHAVRVVVGGGLGQGVTADEIRGGLDELIAHARTCPAAADATAALVERLTRERFGNPSIGMRG